MSREQTYVHLQLFAPFAKKLEQLEDALRWTRFSRGVMGRKDGRLSETAAEPSHHAPPAPRSRSHCHLEGVHFEMLDDLNERVRLFHTRAGFEKLGRN